MQRLKKWSRMIALFMVAVFGVVSLSVQNVKAETCNGSTGIIYGADVGNLSQLESQGITWVDDNGVTTDALQLLKDRGIGAIRIRAFVKPNSNFYWTKNDGTTCILGYADTQGVLYTAQRAKALGMKISLVLHYSDHYADPEYQDIPSEWTDASATQLSQYVYDYTYYLMNELKKLNIYPEWVQVGNEINSGMLLPYGSSSTNFAQLTQYLNSGYDAVKAVSPNTQVVTHLSYTSSGDSVFLWFFNKFLNEYGGKTDIIGASYYPYWVGSNQIELFTKTLYKMATDYNKPVMICETGNLESDGDGTYELLRQEINAINAIPNNKGVAMFYWEPEVNSTCLPDEYILGATTKVSDKVYKFNSGMNAFKTSGSFLSSETSFEIENCNSGKALNVQSGSSENYAAVEQYGYGKWNSQKWYFEEVESGYYKITSKNSGKVLDVQNMSTTSGTACIQYDYNGGWNQMWKIIATEDGKYKIQNRLSGLYLGIQNSSGSDGAVCVQMSDDNSNNVKWYFLVTE